MAQGKEEAIERTGLTERAAKARALVPVSCHACRGWPHVRLPMDGEPEPPTVCDACGREWHGLTRVFVIERMERDNPDG